MMNTITTALCRQNWLVRVFFAVTILLFVLGTVAIFLSWRVWAPAINCDDPESLLGVKSEVVYGTCSSNYENGVGYHKINRKSYIAFLTEYTAGTDIVYAGFRYFLFEEKREAETALRHIWREIRGEEDPYPGLQLSEETTVFGKGKYNWREDDQIAYVFESDLLTLRDKNSLTGRLYPWAKYAVSVAVSNPKLTQDIQEWEQQQEGQESIVRPAAYLSYEGLLGIMTVVCAIMSFFVVRKQKLFPSVRNNYPVGDYSKFQIFNLRVGLSAASLYFMLMINLISYNLFHVPYIINLVVLVTFTILVLIELLDDEIIERAFNWVVFGVCASGIFVCFVGIDGTTHGIGDTPQTIDIVFCVLAALSFSAVMIVTYIAYLRRKLPEKV